MLESACVFLFGTGGGIWLVIGTLQITFTHVIVQTAEARKFVSEAKIEEAKQCLENSVKFHAEGSQMLKNGKTQISPLSAWFSELVQNMKDAKALESHIKVSLKEGGYKPGASGSGGDTKRQRTE